MLKELDDYSWKEAFGYAGEPGTEAHGDFRISGAVPGVDYDLSPFTREDVAEVAAMREGENDGPEWVIYGRLRDGRWFYLEAGCDYQASGSAVIGSSKEEVERFGLTQDARERLGVTLLPA